MAESLTILSTQYDFPRVDLSDDNADFLELMMANVQLLHQTHVAAERDSYIFRIGHPAILRSVARKFDDAEALAAVNAGAAAFEAITSIVHGISKDTDITPANREFVKLMEADDYDIERYFDSSLDVFRAEMPRTRDVITASTGRHFKYLTNYALLGAAMSRRFDLDSAA